MTAQVLDRTLLAYRIGDPRGAYPIFDATGSTIAPGRWNTPASPIIYASLQYSTALLEKLVHGSGALPPNQHYVEITIAAGVTYEVFSEPALPGWDAIPPHVSKVYGETWVQEARSAVLLVPSVITRIEQNAIINPAHPEFRNIGASLHRPVFWDRRLFGS